MRRVVSVALVLILVASVGLSQDFGIARRRITASGIPTYTLDNHTNSGSLCRAGVCTNAANPTLASYTVAAGAMWAVMLAWCHTISCGAGVALADISSVTSSCGADSFTASTGKVTAAGVFAVRTWYLTNATGGTCTITVVIAASTNIWYLNIMPVSFTGSAGVGTITLDRQGGAESAGTTSITATTGGNITQNNEVLLAICRMSVAATKGSASTLLDNVSTDSTLTEYQIGGTSGSTASQNCTQGSSFSAIAEILTFK